MHSYENIELEHWNHMKLIIALKVFYYRKHLGSNYSFSFDLISFILLLDKKISFKYEMNK